MKNGTAFTDRTDGWQTLPFTEEVKDRDPRLAQSIRTPGYKRIGAKRVQGPDLGVTITGYQSHQIRSGHDCLGRTDRP